jgi:hypothetical protein
MKHDDAEYAIPADRAREDPPGVAAGGPKAESPLARPKKRSVGPRSREFLTPLRAAVRDNIPDCLDKPTERLANEIIQAIQNEPMPPEEELSNAMAYINKQRDDEMNILKYSFKIQRFCADGRLRLQKDTSNDDSGGSVPKIKPWPNDLARFPKLTEEDRARVREEIDQVIERFRKKDGSGSEPSD